MAFTTETALNYKSYGILPSINFIAQGIRLVLSDLSIRYIRSFLFLSEQYLYLNQERSQRGGGYGGLLAQIFLSFSPNSRKIMVGQLSSVLPHPQNPLLKPFLATPLIWIYKGVRGPSEACALPMQGPLHQDKPLKKKKLEKKRRPKKILKEEKNAVTGPFPHQKLNCLELRVHYPKAPCASVPEDMHQGPQMRSSSGSQRPKFGLLWLSLVSKWQKSYILPMKYLVNWCAS